MLPNWRTRKRRGSGNSWKRLASNWNSYRMTPIMTILRDKQQRLRGILIWQFQGDYKPRLRQTRQLLDELETLLD